MTKKKEYITDYLKITFVFVVIHISSEDKKSLDIEKKEIETELYLQYV